MIFHVEYFFTCSHFFIFSPIFHVVHFFMFLIFSIFCFFSDFSRCVFFHVSHFFIFSLIFHVVHFFMLPFLLEVKGWPSFQWLGFPSFLGLGLARPSYGWGRPVLLQVGICPSLLVVEVHHSFWRWVGLVLLGVGGSPFPLGVRFGPSFSRFWVGPSISGLGVWPLPAFLMIVVGPSFLLWVFATWPSWSWG